MPHKIRESRLYSTEVSVFCSCEYRTLVHKAFGWLLQVYEHLKTIVSE